jgi:MoaA/NifB/PqqE/SkfB family radical SAM enzyme
MCPLHDNPQVASHTGEKPGFMEFDLFKKVIDDVVENTVTICLQGGGEPMLHPRFFDMIKYVRSKSPSVSIWFNTNGSKMDENAANFMKENNVSKIYFSLDAVTRKTYESIRKGGDWELINKNLRYLSKIAKDKIHIGVSFVVQPRNVREKYRFLKKYIALVDEIVFYTLADKDRKREKKFDVNFSQRPICPLLKEQKYITLEGIVTPCCGALKDCNLGDMKKQSYRDILSSDKFMKMIESQRNGKWDDCHTCVDCTQWLGSYTVSVSQSLLRRVWEVGLSAVVYNYSMSVTSEVYSKIKGHFNIRNILNVLRRACSLH